MRLLPLVLVMVALGACFDAATDEVDGGAGGGGASGGGSGGGGGASTSGAFCAPCVSSADCKSGALCLGGTNPRCGQNCATTNTCPGTLTCQSINSGKAMLGKDCIPSDAACGPHAVGEGLNCVDTWSNYGGAMMANTCVGACHRHDLSWTNVADVRASADSIRLAVENGNMPQGQTLTAAERLRLLTWLACGAP